MDHAAVAGELWESAHPIASSLLAYPEGRAALAAARRAGRIASAGHGKAVEELDATCAELLLVGIDEEYASGLALGPATAFITWDVDLSAAAHESGLAVAPPT